MNGVVVNKSCNPGHGDATEAYSAKNEIGEGMVIHGRVIAMSCAANKHPSVPNLLHLAP